MSQFDILCVSQKAIKGSAIVDFLTERANEKYELLQIEEEKSPEENGWKMYFDGASNALGRGVRIVLISPEGNHCPFTVKLSFDCTNNVAK